MNNGIQNKMLSFEVSPPPRVWEEIVAAMEHPVPGGVTEKLAQYEEQPAGLVWNKISADLHHAAKVVPFYTRYRKHLKYAGATAAIIIFLVAANLLIGKRSSSELTPSQSSVTSSPVRQKNSVPAEQRETSPEKNEIVFASNPEKKATPQPSRSTRASSYTPNEELTSMALLEKLIPETIERQSSIINTLSVDKYMVYSSGDGKAVRLPKKLFDAIACKTQDVICRQRIKTLQQKAASSAVTADFGGLIEILDNLQENQ